MRESYRRAWLVVLAAALALLVMGGSAGGKKQASPVPLTPHEELLAGQIGFDREILRLVKGVVPGHFHRMNGYDRNGYQIVVNGFTVAVPEQESGRALAVLRQSLSPKKHMAFLVEVNETIRSDKVGILKGTDPYDILRVMQTNGDDYDITNEDIIERLKEWGKKHPFEILGAEYDWVELEFKTVPEDVRAFAEEVSDFCPDAAGQDAGGIDGLIRDITDTKRLLLWWDR